MTASAIRRRFILLVAGGFIALPGNVLAHDARPLSIAITEIEAHTYRVNVMSPPSIDVDNQPQIAWPDGCAPLSQSVRNQSEESQVLTMLLRCSTALESRRIGIGYPLFNPAISTLFRFTPSGQSTRTAVLSPFQDEWQVPAATTWKTVARDYFLLGVKHIWGGIDHLLFVLGLMLLARTPRRIAIAITGFTLAHSLTLSLSALGLVRLPVPPTEAGIALSILFLAREIARPHSAGLARRFPLAISSSFGLLHGFGFATALREAGLPRNEIASALLFFNAGVESGQLMFIAVALAVIGVALRSIQRPALQRLEFLSSYALGLAAAFWLFQRLQAF